MDRLTLVYFVTTIISYIIGSCPNGYIVGKAHGIDIRSAGSGNIGATNVLRVVGKKWGYLVFILDAFKGFAAVYCAMQWASTHTGISSATVLGIVAALGCTVGHTFPVWLGFRGGKGVATSAGTLLALMPLSVLSAFLVWAGVFWLTRYVSLASIVAALALPCFVALYLQLRLLHGEGLLLFSLLIATVVIWRHRSNIQRLIQGTEQSFGSKR